MISKTKLLISQISIPIKSVLLSYSQIFFSNNFVFSIILLMVSFFDFWGGLAGLISVVTTNIIALIMGFNKSYIKQGLYGFNSLLVGLGIGVYYSPSIEFYFVLIVASLLTLFLTVALQGIIGKYGLPFLSLPFLFSLWIILLATRQFEHLEISHRGVFIYNELYDIGGHSLVKLYTFFENIPLEKSLITYFRSLGAIFFQYSVLAGVLIAIGLLIYSRIAFSLSLISFYTAFYFYSFIGADIHQLSNSFVGFNFILTAIAIGGYFVVASRYSYLWVVVLTPLIAILIASLSSILQIYQLAIYSLPFNIVVILFLYILKFRIKNFKRLHLVDEQNHQPETNLYNQQNYAERFSKSIHISIELPVRGDWTVTQAHNGDITHRDDWQHAWDFEISNNQGDFFHGSGYDKNNYFCYNKPVYAPGDGWVENIINAIDDNPIGNVDLEHNWGNTIIIKHGEGLYSNISHLKRDSFKVFIGDYVKRGDIIAHCGNSGRSPKPHIHFQLQQLPFIGSKTINFPIVHYIEHNENEYKIHFYDIPKNGDRISNITPTSSIENGLKFTPGQKLSFEKIDVKNNTVLKSIEWEVLVDYYNQTYLYCSETKSSAYYYTDGKVFMFTKFYGDKKSDLFQFFLSLYRISTGYYSKMIIKDTLPITLVNYKMLLFFQDFLAPFYIFLKTKYSATYVKKTEDFSKNCVLIDSKIAVGIYNFDFKTRKFNLEFSNRGIESIGFSTNKSSVLLKQIFSQRTI